jgi:hypothetical protein
MNPAAHVELVDKFVDHDVVALRGRGAGVRHILPTQGNRAARHGLARHDFVVLVHDPGIIGLFPRRDHLGAVHHDAHEIVVPLQGLRRHSHVQHRQRGLRGNGHGDLIRDRQVACAMKLLLPQKQLGQMLEAQRVGGGAVCEERVARQHVQPKCQRYLGRGSVGL